MTDGQATYDVMARPEVRRALTLGDWTGVLGALLDSGLSQSRIASLTGLSQSQVSRLARGVTRRPSLETIRALCDGLGLPRRMAGLAEPDETKEQDTDRRQFLASSLAMMASGDTAPHGQVGDERWLTLTTMTYRQLEQRISSRLLAEAVGTHLRLARQLATGARGRTQTQMFGAVSEAAGLAAWLHADMVEPAKARKLYQLSIAAAHRSGHRLLPTYMQASLGQYATSAGDPLDGLRLIRDAAARLPQPAPRQALAWLSALEGVALAHLGDRAALRALETAERHAETAANEEPVWPWMFRFGPAKLAAHRAVAAARLGLPKAAARAFASAMDSVHNPKQAAVLAVERARALAAEGQAEEAAQLAQAALRTGRSYDSERVRHAVRDLRAGLPSSRVTVDLDAALYESYSPEGKA